MIPPKSRSAHSERLVFATNYKGDSIQNSLAVLVQVVILFGLFAASFLTNPDDKAGLQAAGPDVAWVAPRGYGVVRPQLGCAGRK